MKGDLVIAGRKFSSRLFVGTGKFGDHDVMVEAIKTSGTELVTVALRRMNLNDETPDDLIDKLIPLQDKILIVPNTSGARTAEEAVLLAELGRELLGTNWVKVEIHPNPRHLMPDPLETLKATETLVKKGFVPLPYVHADPVLCKRLEEVGSPVVMPLAAPIGTNLGMEMKTMLEIIISEGTVPVIVDAGIGAPSHAAEAMELGADAVLVNTAIATAGDPVQMAKAFKLAVEAGRLAYESGLPPTGKPKPTSPTDTFNLLDEVERIV